jgi:hypothetical protein
MPETGAQLGIGLHQRRGRAQKAQAGRYAVGSPGEAVGPPSSPLNPWIAAFSRVSDSSPATLRIVMGVGRAILAWRQPRGEER